MVERGHCRSVIEFFVLPNQKPFSGITTCPHHSLIRSLDVSFMPLHITVNHNFPPTISATMAPTSPASCGSFHIDESNRPTPNDLLVASAVRYQHSAHRQLGNSPFAPRVALSRQQIVALIDEALAIMDEDDFSVDTTGQESVERAQRR